MMAIICALLGLAVLLAHDFQSIGNLKSRIWRLGFWAGATLWIASVLLLIYSARAEIVVWRAVVFGSLTLIFILFEIYALFFALPFEKTYVHTQEKRCVCRRGIYGLCRHPGFWSFSGICLSLALAVNTPSAWIGMGILAVMNLIYIMIQDKWIFIREFSDYVEYQKEVPFLLPNCKNGKHQGRERG